MTVLTDDIRELESEKGELAFGMFEDGKPVASVVAPADVLRCFEAELAWHGTTCVPPW